MTTGSVQSSAPAAAAVRAAAPTANAAALVVTGEERMPEGLIQTEAFARVVLHHLLDQVKEQLVVFTSRHHVMLQGLAVFSDISSRRAVHIPIQLAPMNISSLPGFLEEMGGDGAQDPFHHGKVFFTVVCLEESSPEVILNEYTADTPDVTGMVPTQI